MGFLSTILDIVFPANCLACGVSGTDLCITCLSNVPPAERESAKWIFPCFDYRHPPIKKAVWLIKYKGKKRLVGVLAEILHGKILEELSELSLMQNFRQPLLIPIPLSAQRYRERGFNQAELLCRELVNLSPSPSPDRRGAGGEVFTLVTNVLIKPKETRHQAHIENRAERLKNIAGSYAVKNAELIKGRNIILIDDVTTTGATLAEARKILKQSGAKKIIAFTIAH